VMATSKNVIPADSKQTEPPRNIVPTSDNAGNPYHPTRSLRALGIERILGREIIAWNHSLGSYGMGGPGFFGLHLAASGKYPAEWLVLTLWAADNWLLFDGRWVAAHPNQYHIQRPLVSYFGGDEDWDELSEKLLGAIIKDARIADNISRLTVEKEAVAHLLEIPENTSLLPLHGGSLTPHEWNPRESHLDAWIISQDGDLIV
jgi:hypothetical protein